MVGEEDDTEPLAQFDIEELMTPELIARIENEKHNPLAPMHVHMLWIGDLSRAPRERQLYSDFGYELIVHTDPEEILEGFHPHVLKAFKLAIPAVVGYDFLKFAMLYKYGGLSVDADTTPAILARPTYRQIGSNTDAQNSIFAALLDDRSPDLSMLFPASGRVALDVVLRESVALPAVVVRIIVRFAGVVPLLAKLRFALTSDSSAAEMEQMIAAHRLDERLEARERSAEWTAPRSHTLSVEQARDVNAVAMLGARANLPLLVEWGLSTSTYIAVRRVLVTACELGSLQVVQLVRERRKWYSITDEELLRIAVEHGQLEVCKWLYSSRRSSRTPSLRTASAIAASRGHLGVLQWIRYECGADQLSPLMLQDATIVGQQHVMEWIHAEQLASNASLAMESAATSRRYDELAWLHESYPENALLLSTLQTMAAGSQRHAAVWLIERFPERYAGLEEALGEALQRQRRRWRKSFSASLRSLRDRMLLSRRPSQQ